MGRRVPGKTKKGSTRLTEAGGTLLFTGLCATCKKVDNCVNVQNDDLPVVECEEYEADGLTFSETIEVDVPTATEKAKPTAREAEGETAIEGLCETCIHRESCTFPRLEGGVWHCEHYE